MLKETVKGWTREWQREGLEKGLEKGLKKGRKEGLEQGFRQGEALLLSRQLERKFGPLPAGARRRIDAADAETLLTWGERVLSAGSLAEVFGD